MIRDVSKHIYIESMFNKVEEKEHQHQQYAVEIGNKMIVNNAKG